MLTYDLKVDTNTITIDFQGDITKSAAELFEHGLFVIADHENRSFFLHFQNVENVDINGMDYILTLMDKVKARGFDVQMVNMTAGMLQIMYEMTGTSMAEIKENNSRAFN